MIAYTAHSISISEHSAELCKFAHPPKSYKSVGCARAAYPYTVLLFAAGIYIFQAFSIVWVPKWLLLWGVCMKHSSAASNGHPHRVILFVSSLAFHPQFVIFTVSSSLCHPQCAILTCSILNVPSSMCHPHSVIPIVPSLMCHPHCVNPNVSSPLFHPPFRPQCVILTVSSPLCHPHCFTPDVSSPLCHPHSVVPIVSPSAATVPLRHTLHFATVPLRLPLLPLITVSTSPPVLNVSPSLRHPHYVLTTKSSSCCPFVYMIDGRGRKLLSRLPGVVDCLDEVGHLCAWILQLTKPKATFQPLPGNVGLLHKRSGQEAYVKGQDITVSAQFAGMLTNDKEWCQSQIEGSILIDDFVYRQQGQFFLHLLSQHSSGSLCL
eukprot:1160118-Pelagomonas_calceolata.AAC.10